MKQIKHSKLFFFSILFILGTLVNTMHMHDINDQEVHHCEICIVDHLNLGFDIIDKEPFIPLTFAYEFEEKLRSILSSEIYSSTQARAPPHIS